MMQRDLVKVVIGVVIGVVLVVAFGGLLDGLPFFGDKKTEVVLSPTGESNACDLDKSSQVRVGKSKQLSWEIKNYCTEAKTVSVGNFRRTEATEAPRDCKAEGPAYPFTDISERTRTSNLAAATTQSDGDVDPTEGRIKLKVKDRDQLDPGELLYYFDVCLDSRSQDPKLVIER